MVNSPRGASPHLAVSAVAGGRTLIATTGGGGSAFDLWTLDDRASVPGHKVGLGRLGPDKSGRLRQGGHAAVFVRCRHRYWAVAAAAARREAAPSRSPACAS
jgi:hypothetical protein